MPEQVKMTNEQELIVRELGYLDVLDRLMKETPSRTVQNYIVWMFVQSKAALLPPELRQPFYDFRAYLSGIDIRQPPERF